VLAAPQGGELGLVADHEDGVAGNPRRLYAANGRFPYRQAAALVDGRHQVGVGDRHHQSLVR
jgi:hypothetical protein